MSKSNLIFKNWLCRCSSLGHIMTSLPEPISEVEINELRALLKECETGFNANGNKTKWTESKAARVKALQKKQKGEDELPSGAKTHLDNVFRSQFWGRKRLLNNKFLYKGNFVEMDSIALLSSVKGTFFSKNKERLSNDYIQGSPDLRKPIFDTKSNWDMETFENAELTPIYKWQLKGYSWLDGTTGGTLAYCLVNSPLELIERERKSLWFSMSSPEEDSPEWIEAMGQLERNHIFDVPAFKKSYPNYDFVNKNDFSIPAELRLKEFEVEFTEEDAEHIKRRVLLSRIYLCEKEVEIYSKFPALQCLK